MIATEISNAWRELRAHPAAALLVVGVLALGLGCMLFVAGIVNGVIVKPLPFANPDQLLDAGLIDNDDAPDTTRFDAIDAEQLLQWREHVGDLAQVAGVSRRTLNLSDGQRPERFDGAAVTANLFGVLGAKPMLGRGFAQADEQPGAPPVVVLSERLWRERYQADPAVIGRDIRINARPARIVGVMEQGFVYPRMEKLWIPATLARQRNGDGFEVTMRLSDGATMAQVQTALDGWYADALQRDPVGMRSAARGVGVQLLTYGFTDRTTRALFWIMALAALLVLAVACANAASLLLTRMVARGNELWLRSALGATRSRLALQLLAQTGLLAVIALALAWPVSQAMLIWVLGSFPSAEEGPPEWMSFDPDLGMFAFAALAALFTAALTALLPALRAGRESSREGGTRVSSGRGINGLIRSLVVGEVALSCALLIGAAVWLQAITRLDRFDLGLDTAHVLTARIGLMEAAYPDATSRNGYVQRLREQLLADPEVEAVTFSASLPGLMGENVDVLEQGLPRPQTGLPNVGHSAVDMAFAETMGAKLLHGRWFNSGDVQSNEQDAARDGVIVVDETFVQRFAPQGDVLGRRFLLEGQGAPRHAVVVGVVRAVQMDDIDDPIQPSVFEPMHAAPSFFSVLVRTRGKPVDFTDGFLRAVARIDPDTPAYWIRSYGAVLNEAVIGVRILSQVFTGFGAVALALALAGLYGVVSFAVAQRTREIGVRRALGAPHGRVLAVVASRSLWQVALGLFLGTALGLPFARLMAAQIPHVASVDAFAWITVVALLALAALVAVFIPARHALRVEPMAALREE